MNRKGFTLIEVLAVIIILAIVLVIGSPYILNAYKNSKLKSEEIFVDRLSDVIDSYVKLNSDTIGFTPDEKEYYKEEEGSSYKVNISKGTIKVEDIINDNLISSEDYVNAGNKDTTCSPSAEIEVYRDSDFVYCYKMSKYELNCLSEEYKNSLKTPATETEDAIDIPYAIDTCIWEEVEK